MTYVIGGLGAAPMGWVATRLKDGDELSVPSRPANSLDKLYGLSWDAIVKGNGIAVAKKQIEAWVLATGGRQQPNGVPVFSSNSVIFLPAGGPRVPVESAPGVAKEPTVSEAGVSPVLAVVGLGLLGVLLFADRKAKKGKQRATV